MKKILILLISSILIAGCKQDQVECVRHFTNLPCDVAFFGFSANELDTIILRQYKAATGYIDLLENDTLFITAPQFKNGVAYSDTSSYRYKGFFTLTEGVNYKLIFPANNKEYLISNIVAGPATDTFITTDHCPLGTGGPWLTTVSSKINGEVAQLWTPNANNFFIKIDN
jgi:hypothetical protein